MRNHTTFRIGGEAELFLRPASPEQAAGAAAACRRFGVPLRVMGNGSNLLVPDEGVAGAVMAFGPAMCAISREGDDLIAQSGATLSQLCAFARREGLTGLEFAWGIPGSVGGAVYMNAGAYGGEMKDAVEAVRIVDETGAQRVLAAVEAEFGYRASRFQREDWLIVEARFALRPGNPDAIAAAMDDVMARRAAKQPLDQPSAGSTFKRPAGGYAAALIDQCGLRGLRVGDAMVSEKHAGFVVNVGEATCADVLALCAEIRRRVLAQTGVELEMEIKPM